MEYRTIYIKDWDNVHEFIENENHEEFIKKLSEKEFIQVKDNDWVRKEQITGVKWKECHQCSTCKYLRIKTVKIPSWELTFNYKQVAHCGKSDGVEVKTTRWHTCEQWEEDK